MLTKLEVDRKARGRDKEKDKEGKEDKKTKKGKNREEHINKGITMIKTLQKNNFLRIQKKVKNPIGSMNKAITEEVSLET